MKAKLIFDLEDEGDKNEYSLAMHAGKMASMIYEARHFIRNAKKHEDHTDKEIDLLEQIENILHSYVIEDI